MTEFRENNPRVLGLITARGGSKGVPRKNIHPLGGRPLLLWGAEAARKSGVIDRLVVSTEDPEIKKVSLENDLEVLDRPPELATDEASSVSVVIHAIRSIEHEESEYGIIAIISPCAPFLKPETIRAAVHCACKKGVDSATSVKEVQWTSHPANLRHLDEMGRLVFSFPVQRKKFYRRQIAPVYYTYCNLCVVRKEVVLSTRTMYGNVSFPVTCCPLECVDIDEPEDLRFAEYLLETGQAVWPADTDF